MSEIKLLPCPFCGGEVKLHSTDNGITDYFISCKECGCRQTGSIHKESVTNAWNTRKPMERIVERLNKQAGEFIDLAHRELSSCSITSKKYLNKGFGVARAIEICKEEGGIE